MLKRVSKRGLKPMSDAIVFVLHDAADEAYARTLAAGLSPRTAFAAPLAQAGGRTQFGAGAVCVVLWTPQLAAGCGLERVLNALPKPGANVLICSVGGFNTPPALDQYGIMAVSGRADADIGDVAAALDYLFANMAELDAQQRGSAKPAPKLGSAALAVKQRSGNFAARSAYGLALTLATAGVTAPVITQMAQASGENVKSAAPPLPQLQRLAVTETADVATVGLASEEMASSTPSVDEWLTEPVEIAAPAPTIERAAEPQLLQVASAPVEIAVSSELLLVTPLVEVMPPAPKEQPVVHEMQPRTKAKAAPAPVA